MKYKGKIIIIFLLNLLTGGFGTLSIPLLFKLEKKSSYFLAIILGLLQILHFVHLILILSGNNSLQIVYDIIGGENVLKFLIQNPKQKEMYNEFEDEADNLKENLGLDDEDDENEEIYEQNQQILKNADTSFLKKFFAVISMLSYFNSLFEPLIKFFFGNDDDDEDKLFDKLKFGIFNPGTAIIITSAQSIKNFKIVPTIISIIGIIMGFLLMFCPFITGFAIYLIKTINNFRMMFLVINVHLLYFGIFGSLFSIIYAFLRKDIDNEISNPLDIKFNCCLLFQKASNFGIPTIIRIIFNLILPGTGTFSLLCKKDYGCNVGIFFTSLIQFLIGVLFHLFNFYIIAREVSGDNTISYYPIFWSFTIFVVSFYYSGIYVILYLEYYKKWPHKYYIIGAFAMTFLNLFTGGLGDILQINNFKFASKNSCCKCAQQFFIILFSIMGIIIQFFFIFIVLSINDLIETEIMVLIFYGPLIGTLYIIHLIVSIIFQFKGKHKYKIN